MAHGAQLAAIVFAAGTAVAAVTAASPFTDAKALRVRGQVERPSEETLAWGRARLAELGVADLPPAQRAARICKYIHEGFEFSPERPPTVAAFIEKKSGNCYAHARLSAFLLRLAGVPARFMYEVHLERKSPESTEQARAAGIGLFGEFHNDHFWVLYQDGDAWVPFDSGLGISNRADFRRVKIDEPAGGVANPPFLLWRESENEAENGRLVNVTQEFWRDIGRKTVPGVPEADWKALLDTLGRLEVTDLSKAPLSEERAAAIAHVGRKFFATPAKR